MEAIAVGGMCAGSYVTSTSSTATVKPAGEKKSGISSNSWAPRGCFVCLRRSSSLPAVRLSASGSSSGLTLSRPRRSNATWRTFTLPTSRSKRLDVKSMATTEDVEAEKELVETDTMERMDKALDSLRGNFNSVRTGRASPALLDRIEVEYYGSLCSLKTIAQINTPDGSTLMITPFDKASLQSIERALLQSDLGLTPSNDGTVIRLNIPQLTQDRRKELLKTVARLAEEAKVALRNVRRDAIKQYEKMEKADKLSEDNARDLSSDIQKMTDEYVKKVDEMLKQKEKDIMTV